MDDLLIVGGGVIGLSLAYELAGHGMTVRLIDRGLCGGEASWAGAGIIPPASEASDGHPLEQLAGLSSRLTGEWSHLLRDETGIDNGYLRSGGIHVARDGETAERLEQIAAWWNGRGIRAEPLGQAELVDLEPAVADAVPSIELAYHIPDECQIRNPRHLQALEMACRRRGVEIHPGTPAEGFVVRRERIEGVRTSDGTLTAASVCVAGGAWSRTLLQGLHVELTLKPVRGQIVLLGGRDPVLNRILNEGARYVVPRPDGRVLVGSTEEDAGFVKETTAGGIDGLLRFATSLVPPLANLAVEKCWAGLRPGTPDGMPYLGRIPGLENAFIAAGHFRSGLTLSAGSAVVLGQLIRGQMPQIDLRPFDVERNLLWGEPATNIV